MSTELAIVAIQHVLRELLTGPMGHGNWVLDREDGGIIGALRQLPSATASSRVGEVNSIAAHAAHLCYALQLLNRWAGGEENPFANANWPGSWEQQEVTSDEWRELLDELKQQGNQWLAAVGEPREWDEISLTGAVASAAHLAYHLGAIKQLAATR